MQPYSMLRRALPIFAILVIALSLWQLVGDGLLWSTKTAQPQQPVAGPGIEAEQTDPDEPAVVSSEDAVRMAVPRDRVVELAAPSGSRTAFGTAHWLTLDDPLIEALQSQTLISPTEIRRLGGHQSTSFDGARFAVEFPSGKPVFFWVECPGYRPVSCFVQPLDEIPLLKLEPCSVFEVEVLDPDSAPLLGANVVITRHAKDDGYLALDWRARLERRYFQQAAATDHAGVALFDVLPRDDLFVWVAPRSPFGLATLDQQSPSGRITVHAHASATLYGEVRSGSGEALSDVYVGVMTADQYGIRTSVGDTTSREDGSYRNEQVTASGEALVAIVYAEGYETQTVPLPFLRPGQEHRIDFRLRKASPRKFRVISPAGHALSGLKLEFANGPYGWIPFASTVDQNGIAETKPVLVDDSDYFVNVYSADTRVFQTTVRTGKSSEIVELVIPHLGRFLGERADVTGFESIEITPQGNGTRSFFFENASVSPWLPAGPAILQRVDRDGSVSPILSLDVLEGEQPWPNLDREFPRVQFGLDLIPEEEVKLIVVGSGSVQESLGPVRSGANSFAIPAPGLESRLISNLRGHWALGSLCADGNDLDLGQLSWPVSSSLRVIAIGPDQIALPHTAVQLFTRAGAFLTEKRADAKGVVELQSLAPGAYLVRVSPRDGHGAPLPANLHEVLIQSERAVEIQSQFRPSDGIELVVPPGPGVWYAELVTAEAIVRETSPPSGIIRFPRVSEAADIFLWSTSHGQISALDRATTELDSRIEFVAPPAIAIQVDAEAAGAVRLLAGSRILGQIPIEGRSQFHLSADSSGGLFLQWIGADRHGRRVALEQVLSERRLPCSPETNPAQVRVLDEMDRPVPGAQLFTLDPSASVLGDSKGILTLEADWVGSQFLLQKPGFHPTRSELALDREYVLRRLSGKIRVEKLPSAEFVRVYPQFPISVQIDQDVAQIGPAGTAEFRPLPAGPYRVEWLTADGQPIAEQEFTLTAAQAQRIIFN